MSVAHGPQGGDDRVAEAPAGREDGARNLTAWVLGTWRSWAVLYLLAVMLLAGLLFAPPILLNPARAFDLLNGHMPWAIIAVAMTLLMIGGGMDLSVGAVMIAAAAVAAMFAGNGSPLTGLSIAPLVGVAVGLVNGFAVAWFRLPPVLVTLGTASVIGSVLAYGLDGRVLLFAGSAAGPAAAIPFPMGLPLFLIAAAIAAFLLHRTVWGRHLFVLGCDESVARFAGIDTVPAQIMTYALTGFAAGVAGALSMAGHGEMASIPTLEPLLLAVSAVLLGGTLMGGGFGDVWRSLAGVMVIILLDAIRTSLGLPAFSLVLLAALLGFASVLLHRGQNKS